MPKYVGMPIKRKEDSRFITGRGTYVDDVRLSGMLYGRILRSPYAHARIKSIDTARAERLRGVVAVLTGRTADQFVRPWRDTSIPDVTEYFHALTPDKVIFAGQEVAAVAATDMSIAEDAVELIDVEYEPLPTLMDPEEAIKPDAPKIHDEIAEIEGNISYRYRLRGGDVEKAFREADYQFKERFATGTSHVTPIEPTGCVASYDAFSKRLTVWMTVQANFWARGSLAEALNMPADRIRVISPDIGGGYGSKADCYPHYVIACVLSMKTGRPVKIVHGRGDDFLVTGHRYAHIRYPEVAVRRDGKLLGWRERAIVDTGAYHTHSSSQLVKGCLEIPGPYKIENIEIDAYCVYTNKTMGAANRGFGHPQALFARERMIDIIADELKIDPLELRLSNMVQPHEIPYESSSGVVWDTPSYPECLRRVAAAVDYERIKAERRPNVGVGFSLASKNCGGFMMTTYADYDTVILKVEPNGYTKIYTSAINHGQGHETFLAQIAAEELGVDMEKVTVVWGDTDNCPFGFGTWGSRTIITTAPALLVAAKKMREKMAKIAAHNLEARLEDMEFADGRFYVKGAPQKALTVEQIARIACTDSRKLPEGVEPNLIVEGTYETPGKTWFDENGRTQVASTYDISTHAAVVEVDPETFVVKILDYAVAHDCGVAVNPMIVEGQIQGGVAHGVGMAMYEDLVWDENGQLLNPTFMDFLVPKSLDVPKLDKVFHVESHSSVLGGFRGAGEQGTIGPPSALANAVCKALGVRVTELPLSPEKLYRLVRQGKR